MVGHIREKRVSQLQASAAKDLVQRQIQARTRDIILKIVTNGKSINHRLRSRQQHKNLQLSRVTNMTLNNISAGNERLPREPKKIKIKL